MPEDTIIVLDFDDAPPISGGGGEADYVTPGDYRLRVETAEKTETKTFKPMVTARFRVSEGDLAGRRLVERYVMPRPGTDDAKFGLSRFHGLLVALGFAEQKKRGVKLDLRKLEGRECIARVDDEYQEARTGADGTEYGASTRSRIVGVFAVNAGNGKTEAKNDDVPDDDEDDDTEEDAVEEAPKPKAKKAKKAEPEATADDDDDLSELDDLL